MVVLIFNAFLFQMIIVNVELLGISFIDFILILKFLNT